MSEWRGFAEIVAGVADAPVLARLSLASVEVVVLAGLVWCGLRLFRIRSPRLRALLWLVVLAKPLVALAIGTLFPVLTLETPEPVRTSTPAGPYGAPADLQVAPPSHENVATINETSGNSEISSGGAPAARDWSAESVVTTVWLAGAALMLLYAAGQRIRLRTWLAETRPAPPEVAQRYAYWAKRLGARRPPRFAISDALESPALAGVVRPLVVIPTWLAESREQELIDWSVRHELMHWKLLDPVAYAVRQVAQILFFFHPVAWWAGHKWEEAAELACDRALLDSESDAKHYADALYQVLAQIHVRRRRPLMGGLFATRTQVGQRIAALLSNPLGAPARLGIATAGLLCVLSALCFAVGLSFAAASPEQVAVSAESGNRASPSGSMTRVLHFPEQLSLGTVKVRDSGAYDKWQIHWEEFAEARGEVAIPIGKDVALYVSDEGASNLVSLGSLKASDLELLSVTTDTVVDQDLVHIEHLTGLKALILQGTTIDGSGFVYLGGMNELEELRLGNEKQLLTDDSMRHLGRLPSLRWLALWGTGISDAGLTYLRPLRELQFLALNMCDITDDGLKVVGDFAELEGLQIYQTKITDAGLAHLAGLTRLKHINILDNGITDTGFHHLESLTTLEDIWISDNPITDEGARILAVMPKLQELYAMRTGLTNAALAYLEGADDFHHLLFSGLNDEGVVLLSEHRTMDSIQSFDAEVTPASIPYFQKMKNLKRLYLSGSFHAAFDRKTQAALQEALPECDVRDPNYDGLDDSGWRDRLYEVYRLEEDENLRRISPPFIPERMDYYRWEDKMQAKAIPEGPDYYTFHWDGGLKGYGMGFGYEHRTLAQVLKDTLKLASFEFEGSVDLLDIQLPGDWIVRDGIDMAAKLDELETIIERDTGHKVAFEQRKVMRDVVVVRGSYEFHPEPRAYTQDAIHIFSDTLDDNEGAGGGSGTMTEFLRWVGSCVNMPFINETYASEELEVDWGNNRSGILSRLREPERSEKLKLLLDNLAAQTSLTFTPDRREVDVWFVVEKNK